MRQGPLTRAFETMCCVALLVTLLPTNLAAGDPNKAPESSSEKSLPAVLWREPTDIASRDLFYGPGGKVHAPHATFTFEKEVSSGSSPKFEVVDEDGVRWRAKLGLEARPETVASRLVWAAGYYADEDYFLGDLRVENMPHLKRGQELVSSGGVMHNVRIERHLDGQKNLGDWRWQRNPFVSQREFNGLRVLMALLNNWDLKDVNNTVLEVKTNDQGRPELHYEVGDLGATFGTPERSWTHGQSKNNLNSYKHSRFITKKTSEYVDFASPGQPAVLYIFIPGEYISRTKMRWIGKHVPRQDAKWIGELLAQLSPRQIRDAFRAAGYPPDQVEAFSTVVEKRIAELKEL